MNKFDHAESLLRDGHSINQAVIRSGLNRERVELLAKALGCVPYHRRLDAPIAAAAATLRATGVKLTDKSVGVAAGVSQHSVRRYRERNGLHGRWGVSG